MTNAWSECAGALGERETELQAAYRDSVQSQMVRWQGVMVALRQLGQALASPDRRVRERAWRLESQRWLEDGALFERLWHSLVRLRVEKAERAGTEGYMALRRRELEYPPAAPAASRRAHLAVEEFVTSVLVRLHERRRRQLGIRAVRPWDLLAAPPDHRNPGMTSEIGISPDMARACIRQLERTLLGWAFGAMIDAFEEWTYGHPTESLDRSAAGATWASLWLRFLPAVDWAGLEGELAGEWQRHDALFLRPGESLARIAGELEVFRGWTEASDSTEWVHAFGACDQPPDGRQQRSFEIDDMDLLDVARRIEDAIEELERSALSE